MLTLVSRLRSCLLLLASLALGCDTERIPAQLCPTGIGQVESMSTASSTYAVSVQWDARTLLNEAEQSFRVFQDGLIVFLEQQGDPKAATDLEDKLLTFALKIHEASRATIGELYTAAKAPASPTNGSQIANLDRLRNMAGAQSKTLHVFARLLAKDQHAAAMRSLRPSGRFASMRRSLHQNIEQAWTQLRIRALPMALSDALSGAFIGEAHAAPLGCYASCEQQEWGACSSCLVSLSEEMLKAWTKLCTDWNSCDTGLVCDVQRLASLATLLESLARGNT